MPNSNILEPSLEGERETRDLQPPYFVVKDQPFPRSFDKEQAMARCEVCGNQYDKTFTITTPEGSQHTFDSFECAIHALAPRCRHCGCMIIGHGMETPAGFFCCAHCAEQMGVPEMQDRV